MSGTTVPRLASRDKSLRETVECNTAPDVFGDEQNFEQAAGLIAYCDRIYFHYCQVTSAGQGRVKLGVISTADTKGGCVHVSELPVTAAGKLFLRIENRFAELRFSWFTDGIDRTTVDRGFDATMLGDRVSPHSNFTFTSWGICCQDLSSRFAWANFDCFNYQPPNMP